MRPIRLRFAGLRSYRAEACIDFADLDLFAIIGDTGAGKSTIIEALSFALYARKTWSGGGSRIEDLIAEGEKLLRIEFTFAAGDHEWTVTRTRNRSTSPGINKLVCLDGPERVDGAEAVTGRVTELIGLDHAQFTRAVVMPQGRFDELLRATRSDRNKLLTSLLGLEDVRKVGHAADALTKRWKEALVEARTKRSALPADPVGAREAARAEADDAAARHVALTAAVTAASAAADAAARAYAAHQRVHGALSAVPAVDGAPWVEVLRSAAKRSVVLLADRAAADADVRAAEERAHAIIRSVEAQLAGFPDRDAAVAARAELQGIAGALAAALDERAAAEAELASLEATPPAAEVPAPLLARAAAAEQLLAAARTERDEAATALAGARAALADLHSAIERETVAAATSAAAARARAQARDEADSASRSASVAADSLAAAEMALDAAVRADAAAAAAVSCAPGDDCPVCARALPDDFTPPAGADIDDARTRLDDARREAAATQHAAARAAAVDEEAVRAVERAEHEHRVARDAVVGATQRATAAGVDVDALGAELAVLAPAAALRHAEQAVATAEETSAAARDEVTGARARAEAAVAAHGREVARARIAASGARQRVDELRRRAGEVPPGWRPAGAPEPDDVRAVVARLEAALVELDVLEGARRQAEAERSEAAATASRIETELERGVSGPARATLAELAVRLDRVRALAAALSATGHPGFEPHGALPQVSGADALDGVADAAAAAAAWADGVREAAVTAAERLAADAEASEARLAQVLADAGFADLGALQAAAGAAGAHAEQARRQREAAERDAETAAALDGVLAVARPFVANLEVLAVSCREQNFIDHLIGIRQAELLTEAGRRLQAITGGRFTFGSDFTVVSINSGEVRSPDSLSGGERFQAALSLALALVEIASRGGGRLDAVFVDEGFGSLDSAALDVALETLGTVAGGGKTVALISHLRPVAEYVDTVLFVEKDDVLGSSIRPLDGAARDRLLADDIRSGLHG